MVEREYFIGTEAECRAFIDKMDILMGYPNAEVKTNTYSIPRKHNKQADVYYVPLKSVYAPKIRSGISLEDMENEMNPDQLTKKRTLSTLKSEGAFPKAIQGEF